jgi:hypothetical protein
MRLTKDEARILAEAMEEYKYKVVENPHYKRRNGRTSQDNFNDLIKRLTK